MARYSTPPNQVKPPGAHRPKHAMVMGLLLACSVPACAPSWTAPQPTDTKQGVYFIDLSGTPPRVRLWGGRSKLGEIEMGPWAANRTKGMLSASVSFRARSRGPVAVTLDMAWGDDPRFGPDLDSFSSAWTDAGRAIWYAGATHGDPRRSTWKIVVPGGHIPARVRLSGRIVRPLHEPSILLEPEDLLAGSAPVRWIRGWLVFPYRPNKSGWASIRASSRAARLSARFGAPETATYHILGQGLTRPDILVDGTKLRCRHRGSVTDCGTIRLKRPKGRVVLTGKQKTHIDALWITRRSGKKVPDSHIIDPRRGASTLKRVLRHALQRAMCHCAEKITDQATWRQRASLIRRRLAKAMDLPDRRNPTSPPKVLVRGKVKGRGFVVQKLWIQSVDGLWASALLYRPDGAQPVPAVLHILGHYKNGKLRGAARILDANLAAAGIAVLAVDNLSFSDRRLAGRHRMEDNHFLGFWHVMAGSSAARVIYGETFRFLDYLWTRPWVDRRRIGVTGSSGGGTASLYLAGMDKRISAASVVAAVSTWDHFGRFRGGDPEQYPFGLVSIADFPTLLGLVAPRPLLVAGGAKDDLFPASQGRKAVERARNLYRLMGAPQAIEFHADSGPHGYKGPRRDATVAFFAKVWGLKASVPCNPGLALPAGRLHVTRPPDMPTLLDVARKRLEDNTKKWARASTAHKRAYLAGLMGVALGPVPSQAPTISLNQTRPFLGLGTAVRIRLDKDRTLPGLLMKGSPWTGDAESTAAHLPWLVHTGGAPASKPDHRRPFVLAVADGGRKRFAAAHVFTELGMDLLVLDLSGWGDLSPDLKTAYGLRRTWKKVERYRSIEGFFPTAYLLVSADSYLALRTRELLMALQACRQAFPHRRIALASQGPVSSLIVILASILDPAVEAVVILDGQSSLRQDLAKALRNLPDVTAPGLLALGDVHELAGLTRAGVLFWAGSLDSLGRRNPGPARHVGNRPVTWTRANPRTRQRMYPDDAFWPDVITAWASAWLNQ